MNSLSLADVLGKGDALIVVPPFAGVDRPSLAAHTLQACARQAGLEVRIFYANLHLASRIGDSNYEAICYAPTSALLGERFFARSAYGVPALGRDDPIIEGAISDLGGQVDLSPQAIRQLEEQVAEWADETAAAIARCHFPVVGFSTTFEQTAASVALLDRLKQHAPDTVVLLGGANCEGEMAEGILSLGSRVDYVFSGESEETFPAVLRELAAGRRPSARIVHGTICRDLDRIPTPDFSDYFRQREALLQGSAYVSDELVWIPYEGSRGCWWGEKHHCTFCGINGQGMEFRHKSADRVIGELREIATRHGIQRICMTDNIMPHRYFESLIPRLGGEVPGLYLFYEQKSNLSLRQVMALAGAGIKIIQPGIEALSTDLLRRMDKGVTSRQNIALLRYARAAGVQMNWNLLYGFPGDTVEEYRQTLALLPQLRHLQPPSDFCRLSIDRFSPYFFASTRYGIRSTQPMESYASVLPACADIRKVAYHFTGDYDSGIVKDSQLAARIQAEITSWKKLWENEEAPPPSLAVVGISEENYIVLDSRGLETGQPVEFVGREQAAAALIGHPLNKDDEVSRWARGRGLALAYEGWHIPLATASAELLARFEESSRAVAPQIAPAPFVQLTASV